jgi:hypothetical protein
MLDRCSMAVLTRAKRRHAVASCGHQVCNLIFDCMMATLSSSENPVDRIRAFDAVRALFVSVKGIGAGTRDDGQAYHSAYRALILLHSQVRCVAFGLPPPVLCAYKCAENIQQCDAYYATTGVKLGTRNRRLCVHSNALFRFRSKTNAKVHAAIIGSLYSEVEIEVELRVNGYSVSSDTFKLQQAALRELVERGVHLHVVVINCQWPYNYPPTMYAGPLNYSGDPRGRGATWAELDGLFAWRRLMDHCPGSDALVKSVHTQRDADRSSRVPFAFGTAIVDGVRCNTVAPIGECVSYRCDSYNHITMS